MTAREYALLEYFMRNQNIVLKKTNILEHVWDYNYEGFSNVVETYVKYLRKKLQLNPEDRELIHTLKRVQDIYSRWIRMFKEAKFKLTLIYSALFLAFFWVFSFSLYYWISNSFGDNYVSRYRSRNKQASSKVS